MELESWEQERVKLWQTLTDALNALEQAGEQPGVALIGEREGDMTRMVYGETTGVRHSDADPVWRLLEVGERFP